ncbi:replication endonuclease [Pseudomonas sp. S36]|uniref:replication endonuclease n=1 Tax=Pseudomonas sp. S36 TaxID=2767447 RepID=UPI0019122383|nr:replication endonuclease [Pseudomonas sp. S36]MBK4987396.1 hypothetical protein [Pseudomonas sp. S36]
MPDVKDVASSELFDFDIGLTITPGKLPPLHLLTSKQVSYLSIRISNHFTNSPEGSVRRQGREYKFDTRFYGVIVSGATPEAVIAKLQSRKLWRRRLQGAADLARLDYEARNKMVGGSESGAELYASDVTVIKAREKKVEVERYLSGQVICNTATGDCIALSELAQKAAANRFNELYWVSKNFEAIADNCGMGWLFVTLTAPPKFHPNPLKGKCSYDADLGVRASHTYILSAWSRVRALLSKRGVKSGIYTYFGIRTAETHKDGSVHWHLLVFIEPTLVDVFTESCRRQFPEYGQVKFEVGDPEIGSASSYIFKYLAKGFDLAVSGEMIDGVVDSAREDSDLASIRNGERVRAALKAMRIRQYQTFGVKNVLSLLRAVNKLSLEELKSLSGEVPGIVIEKIWRKPLGLKFLLENDFLIAIQDGEAPIMIVKEAGVGVYGEATISAVGLKIGTHIVRTRGRYKIEKAK